MSDSLIERCLKQCSTLEAIRCMALAQCIALQTACHRPSDQSQRNRQGGAPHLAVRMPASFGLRRSLQTIAVQGGFPSPYCTPAQLSSETGANMIGPVCHVTVVSGGGGRGAALPAPPRVRVSNATAHGERSCLTWRRQCHADPAADVGELRAPSEMCVTHATACSLRTWGHAGGHSDAWG